MTYQRPSDRIRRNRPTTTHNYPQTLVIKWAFGILLVCLLLYWILGSAAAQTATPKPFDHSQCQYPDRSTNPVDGCDNSDPCDPEQTKGGSGECIVYPKVNNNIMSHNIESVDNTVDTVENWGK